MTRKLGALLAAIAASLSLPLVPAAGSDFPSASAVPAVVVPSDHGVGPEAIPATRPASDPSLRPAARRANRPACTIRGSAGRDVLVGTPRRDVICAGGGHDVVRGLGGNDVILGGPGRDRILGGAGADTIHGDGGNDSLRGQTGNDDLSGGQGADEIAGGGGTNWCTVNSADQATRCVHDVTAPRAVAAEFDKASVNVSQRDAYITVRVRLTDDTGVASADLSLVAPGGQTAQSLGRATLQTGTVRSGWWVQEARISRWSAPGSFYLEVSLRDRVGRWTIRSLDDPALRVVNTAADTQGPKLTLLSPLTEQVLDVRTAAKSLPVEARVTDDGSGVWYVWMCAWRPAAGYYANEPCVTATRKSGTKYSGVWSANIPIPRGASTGTWNIEVISTDEAHRLDHWRWLGPEVYAEYTSGGHEPDPWLIPFPAPTGRFTVVGVEDVTLPQVVGVTLGPPTIDTLQSPRSVRVDVQALDAEGVTGVWVVFYAPPPGDGSEPLFPTLDLTLASGTSREGVWTGNFTFPQGLPPGPYFAHVVVQDIKHWRSYMSVDAPHFDETHLPLPGHDRVVVIQP